MRSGGRVDAAALSLVGAVFITHLSAVVLAYLLAQEYPAKVLHAGPAFGGLALSAYLLANRLSQPVLGWVADRWGPRPVLVWGSALSLGPIALAARSPSAWAFLVACVLLGATHGEVWPSSFALIARRYRPELRGRLSAALDMTEFAGLGAGLAGGAYLIQQSGFGAGFWLAGAAMAAGVPLAMLQPPGRAAGPGGTGRPDPAGLKGVLRRDVLLLLASTAAYNVGMYLLLPIMVPLAHRLHLSLASLVLVALPGVVVAAAAILPAGWLADRYPRRRLLVAGLALATASLLALSLAGTPWVFGLLTFPLTVGFAMALPTWDALMLDVASPGGRALAMGLGGTLSGLGGSAGAAVGGLLAGLPWGVSADFLLAGGVMAMATLAAWGMGRQGRERTG